MLTSKWRVRSHRHLGTIQVPIIDLEIQDARGSFVPFSLCIDSGAVISLLPHSATQYLGLDPSLGRRIELGGVGHHGLRARLHELSVHLTGLPPITVPFAIAEQDNVPGLLGRLGIFDQLEITFDPVQRETRLRPLRV
jgi:hypothetical protein